MKKLTFADVPNREQFLTSPEAIDLLATMPLDVADKFKRCFLNGDLLDRDIKDVHNFFLEYSSIIRIVTSCPSSAETFEYLYHKRPVENEVDRYFIRAKEAIGIEQRLLALRQQLPDIITQGILRLTLTKGQRFVIFNVGSGPGHDLIEVLEANPVLQKFVEVVCIDPDENMLAIGERRVKELGMADIFRFVPKKFGEAGLGEAHMILMIGILCPVSHNNCVKILKNASRFLHPSGILVYNTVQTRMVMGDPLCDFIIRMAGWHLDYKEDSESLEIAKEAGLEPIHSFFDSLQYNCMVIARRASD